MAPDKADNNESRPVNKDAIPLDRRQYLGLTGGTIAAAVGGVVGSASAATTRDGISFSQTLDAVSDLGMDSGGSERIDSKLESAASDGTLVVFPEGEYKMGSVSLSGLQNFGVVAADGANPTFVAPGNLGDWLHFPNGDNILIEGFDFDMRGDGVGGTINMQMDGSWVLRDVRKIGEHPDTLGGFRFAVNDAGETGLAERCVSMDGSQSGKYSVGVFVPTAHAGELTIRDCQIGNFSNNGLYASPPAKGGDGPVQVEGGLFKNNNIAAVRLGSTGSYARGVTIVNDKAAKAGHGSRNQRGFYLRQGGDDITIEDCDVCHSYEGAGTPVTIGSAATGSGCSVTESRFENNTGNPVVYLNDSVADGWSGAGNSLTGSGNLTAPSGWISCSGSGCTSPSTTIESTEDGTGGTDGTETSSGDQSSTLENTLVVDGSDVSSLTTYSFTTSGSIERSGELGSLDDADSVDGSTASGSTWGGVDGYRFSGEITDLSFDGAATLLVNGQEVDPSTFGAEPDLPNALVIDSSSVDTLTTYSFTVTDEVVRSEELGSLDDADSVTGTTAQGSTWGGVDGYRFAGEIAGFEFNGGATVYLNGTEIDPSSFGSNELPNTLTIDGTTIDGEAIYDFEVTGEVEKHSDAADLESDDTIDGAAVSGSIGNDIDTFRYSGDLVMLSVDGAAVVKTNVSNA